MVRAAAGIAHADLHSVAPKCWDGGPRCAMPMQRTLALQPSQGLWLHPGCRRRLIRQGWLPPQLAHHHAPGLPPRFQYAQHTARAGSAQRKRAGHAALVQHTVHACTADGRWRPPPADSPPGQPRRVRACWQPLLGLTCSVQHLPPAAPAKRWAANPLNMLWCRIQVDIPVQVPEAALECFKHRHRVTSIRTRCAPLGGCSKGGGGHLAAWCMAQC
jgi:hypothetical protein